MSRILINNTSLDIAISDIGRVVPASGQLEIDDANVIPFSNSNDLFLKIASGDISYSDGLNTLSLTDAIDHLKNIQQRNELSSIQKTLAVSIHKPEHDSFARATHDFCNKNTWYTKSTRVSGEQPSNTDLVYSLAHQNVIDVVNGIVNRQDTLQQYAVHVYDNGQEISNYTIDHTAGTITLDSAASGVITVDYSYATTSEWVLSPDANTMLIIEHSEVQFAKNVSLSTPLRFEIWVYNPADLPNKVMYQAVQYNSIRDLVNEANLGTGTIPAMDGLPECVVFPFNYATIKPLNASYGAELVIRSVGDQEISGDYGTATFYLIKIPEGE